MRVWPTRLHAWHSCSVFTALWCGCFVVKLTLYFHQTPSWLWLVWTNSPVFTPPGYRPVGTMVQIIPGLHCIMDMRQVRQYPDCSIYKILSVLKWWMITTLYWKLFKKQRVQNRFASYEVHTGHFFTMSMLLSVLEIVNLVNIQISKFFTGLTN